MGTRSQSPLYFKDINSHSKCMHWWKIKKPSPQWTLCTILVHIEPLSTLTLLYKWNDESSPGSTSIDLHSITTNLQSSYSVYSNFRTSDNQSMKVICHSLQVRLFVCMLMNFTILHDCHCKPHRRCFQQCDLAFIERVLNSRLVNQVQILMALKLSF